MIYTSFRHKNAYFSHGKVDRLITVTEVYLPQRWPQRMTKLVIFGRKGCLKKAEGERCEIGLQQIHQKSLDDRLYRGQQQQLFIPALHFA